MELIADDRERSVIRHLEKTTLVRVERITVGDYAFVYNGRIITIVERKTLNDLASSIKDGRMENNAKLLDARLTTGCLLLYIIEGAAYPDLGAKFSGVPFNSLQGKLDSLMFRHGTSIIWTRDDRHTAKRLAGLLISLGDMARTGTFPPVAHLEGTPAPATHLGGAAPNAVATVLQKHHDVTIDSTHVSMLNQISGINTQTALTTLKLYTIRAVLTGDMDGNTLYNLPYPSGYKMGDRGLKLLAACKGLPNNHDLQAKILSAIKGVTAKTARTIIAAISLPRISSLDFPPGAIASLPRTATQRLGNAFEQKIRCIFDAAAATATATNNPQLISIPPPNITPPPPLTTPLEAALQETTPVGAVGASVAKTSTPYPPPLHRRSTRNPQLIPLPTPAPPLPPTPTPAPAPPPSHRHHGQAPPPPGACEHHPTAH